MVVPEKPVVQLIPSVKGEVKEVLVKTDDAVKKDQVLVRMDDRVYRETLNEAEAGVAEAEGKLEEAKQALELYESGRKAQLTAIEAKKALQRAAEKNLELRKKAMDAHIDARAEGEYEKAKAELDAARWAVQAEEEKLKAIEAAKPSPKIKQAEAGLKYRRSLAAKAKLNLELCELRAPDDGTIMQSLVSPGDKFGEQFVKPAFLFYSGKLIVKAKVNQEWASRVKVDQLATVKDPNSGQTWKGKVTYVAKSFLPDRDPMGGLEGMNLLQPAAELVLECRITLDPDQSTPPPLLNQKVSVTLGQ
jgi:membrane fusion protein (multidrug efflux system)